MARPTYSIKGARLNFNDLRAQSRRVDPKDVPAPKKPVTEAPDEDVDTQELLSGFIPVDADAVVAAPSVATPKPVPAAVTPAVATTPAAAPVTAPQAAPASSTPKAPDISIDKLNVASGNELKPDLLVDKKL